LFTFAAFFARLKSVWGVYSWGAGLFDAYLQTIPLVFLRIESFVFDLPPMSAINDQLFAVFLYARKVLESGKNR
jgi:hypothetical protein